jgi:malate permease and related proteins
MIDVLLNVLVPVIACVAIGFGWGKSGAVFPNEFVTRIVTYVGAPALIISTMKKSALDWQMLVAIAQGTLLMMAGLALLSTMVFRLLGKPFRPLSLAVIFPNTGNIGLSLCFFAFGEEGLAIALMVFVVIGLVHFACGDFVLNAQTGFLNGFLTGLRQPIVLATLFVIVQLILDFELPKPVLLTSELLGGMTIPLMLIALGVSLSVIDTASWKIGMLISVLRVFGGLGVACVAVWLVGIQGLVAKVIIVQSAMPSAVFNYFFALKYNREVEAVASAIMISTVISLIVMAPLLWFFLSGWSPW